MKGQYKVVSNYTLKLHQALKGRKTYVLTAGAQVVQTHARDYATRGRPWLNRITGALEASIVFKVVGDFAYIGSDLIYAAVHELGNFRTPARPYLRPGLENHIKEVRTVMTEKLIDLIKGSLR